METWKSHVIFTLYTCLNPVLTGGSVPQTQMAERSQEFEELLKTEQLEKEEIVRRVVEENQETVRALQHSLEQEREQSHQQVLELQKETDEMRVRESSAGASLN